MPSLKRPRRPWPGHLRRIAARALAGLLAATALAGCSVLHAATREQDRSLAAVAPGTWRIDPSHCSVVFSVDHLGFSRFIMRFDRVAGTLHWPARGVAGASIHAWVATASVDTNDPQLDAELRSPAMLDAARHRYIEFQGSGWRATGPARGDLEGVLRLGKASEPVVLHLRFHGYGVDPVTGQPTLGFSARAAFSRAGLGLRAWPGFVGDTVRLHVEAEFIPAAPPACAGPRGCLHHGT